MQPHEEPSGHSRLSAQVSGLADPTVHTSGHHHVEIVDGFLCGDGDDCDDDYDDDGDDDDDDDKPAVGGY